MNRKKPQKVANAFFGDTVCSLLTFEWFMAIKAYPDSSNTVCADKPSLETCEGGCQASSLHDSVCL